MWAGTATRLGACQLRNRGSIPSKGKISLSYPQQPCQLWARSSFTFSGYMGVFSKLRHAKFTAKPDTTLRLRISGAMPPFTYYTFMTCTVTGGTPSCFLASELLICVHGARLHI